MTETAFAGAAEAAGQDGAPPSLHPARTCLACPVRSRAACGCVDEAGLAALNGLGRKQRLERGQALSWAGDESLSCGMLISGMLKLSAATAGGREQIVGLLYPSDFVGRLYAEDRAEVTVSALTDVELCLFPRPSFEQFLSEHADMERRLFRAALAALDDARARMLMLARRSAEERIAGFLLEMADRFAPEDGEGEAFDLPLSRGQIADVLGLTIETVSRQLTRLKSAGVIRLKGARAMAVTDRDALEMRAEAA